MYYNFQKNNLQEFLQVSSIEKQYSIYRKF